MELYAGLCIISEFWHSVVCRTTKSLQSKMMPQSSWLNEQGRNLRWKNQDWKPENLRNYMITLAKCFLITMFIMWKECYWSGRNLLMYLFNKMSINLTGLDWTHTVIKCYCFKQETSTSFPPWTTGIICSTVLCSWSYWHLILNQ